MLKPKPITTELIEFVLTAFNSKYSYYYIAQLLNDHTEYSQCTRYYWTEHRVMDIVRKHNTKFAI